MKIDPNQAVESSSECVLCEAGRVHLYGGRSVPQGELELPNNEFREFCRSLDPNKIYISACVPEEADREVFFAAKAVASGEGIYMQAIIETAANSRTRWNNYLAVKQIPAV